MLRSIIKFARIRIIATCFALVFVGAAAGGGLDIKIVAGLLMMIAFTVHANSINDYADREIDAINLQGAGDRPLVSGDISNRQFWLIHAVSVAATLALSAFFGWRGIGLSAIVLLIDYAYSIRPLRITDRTFLSPVLLAITYTYYSFTVGFWAVPNPPAYPWLLTAGLCLGFMARLLLKDFRDVKGDQQHGKLTFLLRFGPRVTTVVSGLLWILSMLLVAAATSYAYGVVLSLIVGALLVWCWLYKLARSPRIHEQEQIVAVIARVGNGAILVILAHLLCVQQTGLSTSEVQLIPLAIGIVVILGKGLYVRPNA